MHGSRLSNAEALRLLRQHRTDVNTTYEVQHANPQGAEAIEPIVQHLRIEQNSYKGFISGSLFVLSNPLKHFAFEQPYGGCGHNRQRTSLTAQHAGCAVATNAGFFDVHNGDCLGTLVTGGKVIQNTGYQNAMFGLTKDGRLITGYLHADQVEADGFEELVAGVIWLVRDGVNYVKASLKVENMTVQATGSAFATIESARTALGHDKDGNVIVLTIDGKSYQRGVNLYEMADILISLGIQNAINLDGGGSATATANGTVVNYPSDECPTQYHGVTTSCERAITSITCFHKLR